MYIYTILYMHVPLSPDLEMYMLVCNLFEIISMPLGLNHVKHLLEKITYHNLFLKSFKHLYIIRYVTTGEARL